MNGMHLLPVYYSTTNTRKRKQNKKSASVLEAERQHVKFLKKRGIGTRSSAGLEQRPSKPWVAGSSPVECAKLESCKPTYNSSIDEKDKEIECLRAENTAQSAAIDLLKDALSRTKRRQP